MTRDQVLATVKAARNVDIRVNLTGADLRGVDLCGVDLREADLHEANLGGADLHGADLHGANLHEVDLRGVYLYGAGLGGANLTGADLRGADLRGVYLTGADLRGADLRGADLHGADLTWADLTGANLTGTCLDPTALVPPITDKQIVAANLTIEVVDGVEWLVGRRSRRSRHASDTDYSEPGEYVAPWLSVDQATPCHPGIYLGGAVAECGDDTVQARCRRDGVVYVSARKGVRTRVLVRDNAPRASRTGPV